MDADDNWIRSILFLGDSQSYPLFLRRKRWTIWYIRQQFPAHPILPDRRSHCRIVCHLCRTPHVFRLRNSQICMLEFLGYLYRDISNFTATEQTPAQTETQLEKIEI